jgi:AraC-like DNA-binding protein
MKMQRARELLEDPNCSIKRIALTLGYSDLAYFSRLFKQHSGTSPTAFRRDRVKNWDKRPVG